MTRVGPGHWHPPTYDRSRYRVVFTATQVPAGVHGLDILRRAATRVPLFEAVVDLKTGSVEEIVEPPRTIPYAGIPVPLI